MLGKLLIPSFEKETFFIKVITGSCTACNAFISRLVIMSAHKFADSGKLESFYFSEIFITISPVSLTQRDIYMSLMATESIIVAPFRAAGFI